MTNDTDTVTDCKARADCKLGYLRLMAQGEITLTEDKLTWVRHKGILDWLIFGIPGLRLWLVRRIEIPRDNIRTVKYGEDWTRAWIVIDDGEERYTFRIGAGPYPRLVRNKEITRTWYEMLRQDVVAG